MKWKFAVFYDFSTGIVRHPSCPVRGPSEFQDGGIHRGVLCPPHHTWRWIISPFFLFHSFLNSPFYKVQCIYCLDVFELLLFCSGLLSWPGRACHHHSHRENCSLQPKTWTAFTNSSIQGVKLKTYSANCVHFWVVLCLCCKFRVTRTSPLLPNRFCYALNIDQVTECNGLNVKLVVLRIISATWKNSCVLHKVSPLLGTPCRCII